jgi:hypothetical protein
VFGSALEQWDALLSASGETVSAAAPILLFYALAQAGRAVCAAHVVGQPWRASRHGLSVGTPTGGLGSTQITPEGGTATSFALFCRAIGSPPLTAPTTLGALWAANPKLDMVPDLGEGEPRAVELGLITSGETSTRALLEGELAEGLSADPGEATAELATRLARYPGATDGLAVGGFRTARDGTAQVEVGWTAQDGKPNAVELIARGYGRPNSGAFLKPALNQAHDVLEPLALWWATLIALSSLARYHPEIWTAALARDRSKAAIPIEDALDIAREMLPWLLLGALDP